MQCVSLWIRISNRHLSCCQTIPLSTLLLLLNTHHLLRLCLICINKMAAKSQFWHSFYLPERDALQCSARHGSGLVHFGRLQMERHVTQPQEGAVGRLENEPVKVRGRLGQPVNVQLLSFHLSSPRCARYGANTRRTLSENYRWDISMLLEEL